ncbi:hypothetical protein NIES37_44930 [Tolypothrix tenuis PCC 7101]|uniref:Uncharacterized protein n=1 Tax=Tolypothrix tenuis PCC 7101 TaxID=231146 RepID=A0A1Z4N491_9CYAN|nr:hypothetical protein [Aulosira sp. FACHB-113]BAZ00501.1 hypothetical protein NIES37_44930 [Tolypothrix tenuis PCC 7101]BAZ75577.1 hypothetical protein NIES50_41650 [Aulosira laxa NIES-50]
MNEQERLFRACAYVSVALIGSLLLYCLLISPFKEITRPFFQIEKTQLFFGIVVILGYLFLITEAASYFAATRRARTTVNLKLYQWRDKPECNVSATMTYDFIGTLRYVMIARFIPFLFVSYASLGFLEACVVNYSRVTS